MLNILDAAFWKLVSISHKIVLNKSARCKCFQGEYIRSLRLVLDILCCMRLLMRLALDFYSHYSYFNSQRVRHWRDKPLQFHSVSAFCAGMSSNAAQKPFCSMYRVAFCSALLVCVPSISLHHDSAGSPTQQVSAEHSLKISELDLW